MIDDIIKFSKKVYSLTTLIRYATRIKILNESVAAHCHQVALISLKLYEQYKDEIKLNLEKMLAMSIIHDLAESELGDIPFPLKNSNKTINTLIEKEEEIVIQNLLGKKYSNIFNEFAKKETIESILVNLADEISAHIYSIEELSLGNINIKEIFDETSSRIQKSLNEIEKYKNAKK